MRINDNIPAKQRETSGTKERTVKKRIIHKIGEGLKIIRIRRCRRKAMDEDG